MIVFLKARRKLARGVISSVSCTGSDPNIRCIASGTGGDYSSLFVITSLDGGKTWIYKNLDSRPADRSIANCTGNGKKAVCVIAGSTADDKFYVSRDGGNTWTLKNILGGSSDRY